MPRTKNTEKRPPPWLTTSARSRREAVRNRFQHLMHRQMTPEDFLLQLQRAKAAKVRRLKAERRRLKAERILAYISHPRSFSSQGRYKKR